MQFRSPGRAILNRSSLVLSLAPDAAAGNAMSARTSRCRVGYRVSRAAIRYTARNAWGIQWPRERGDGSQREESLPSRSGGAAYRPGVRDQAQHK